MPPARRNAGRPAKRTAPARKAAPAPAASGKEPITAYATKKPTPYHIAMARWAVNEIGYDPDSASSKKAAFLRGIAIASAARPAFQASSFLEEWRAVNGVEKTGPKRAEEKPAPATRRRKPAPEPEPEVDEDEDDFEDAAEEDEFEDDAESDEDFEDEDAEEDDEEEEGDDDFEEEEPAPAPKRRPAKKAAPVKAARQSSARNAAGKARTSGSAPARKAAKPAAQDDDDFLF
jgi:hypothetical protein